MESEMMLMVVVFSSMLVTLMVKEKVETLLFPLAILAMVQMQMLEV